MRPPGPKVGTQYIIVIICRYLGINNYAAASAAHRVGDGPKHFQNLYYRIWSVRSLIGIL